MQLTLVILSALLVVCVGVSIFIDIKKRSEKWFKYYHYLILLFSIGIFGTCLFILFKDNTNASDAIRSITMVLTAGIALLALLNTTKIANTTMEYNLENQKSTFIMGLINSHYKILEDKSESLAELWEMLNNHFKQNVYAFNKACENLKGKFYNDRFVATIVDGIIKNLEEKNASKNQRIITDDIRILRNLHIKPIGIEKLTITLMELSQKPEIISFYELLPDKTRKMAFTSETLSQIESSNLLSEFEKHYERNRGMLNGINQDEYTDLFEEVNSIFNIHYPEVGHVMRNSYRIVKTINAYYENNLEQRKTFLGILRSQYSEDMLLLIYYNSVYSEKGLGYAKQLLGSDFFGTKAEIDATSGPVHVRKDNLLFKHDSKVIKGLFSQNVQAEVLDIKEKVQALYKEP